MALSAGFLNLNAPATAPNAHGFPEPPPPPGAIEELSAGDWGDHRDAAAREKPTPCPRASTTSSKSCRRAAAAGRRHAELDRYAELEGARAPRRACVTARTDDFLANMTAAMNGGIMTGAPTIDVSTLTATPVASEQPPDIDFSHLDVPLTGKQTLPLFALTNDDEPTVAAARPPAKARSPRPNAGTKRRLAQPRRAGSARARKQKPEKACASAKTSVAPATKSEPPTASGQRRSGLAAPVLLALAGRGRFSDSGSATRFTATRWPTPSSPRRPRLRFRRR